MNELNNTRKLIKYIYEQFTTEKNDSNQKELKLIRELALLPSLFNSSPLNQMYVLNKSMFYKSLSNNNKEICNNGIFSHNNNINNRNELSSFHKDISRKKKEIEIDKDQSDSFGRINYSN